MNVHGKVAIVTGASRGVGKATALALAQKGCSVLVNYNRSRKEAEQVTAAARKLGVRALCIQADTADEAACRSMVDAAVTDLGRLDVLVNNAATTRFIPHQDLSALSDELWDRIFDVNLKGPFYCARAARPHLEAAEGEIVNVASVAGLTGSGSSIPYCASKAALICLTQSLARAFGPRVRVNAVAPGFIISRWTEDGLGPQFESAKQSHEERAALGKVCQPEDVAEVIVGLISGSDLITGQTIVVDGGAMVGAKS
jgi:NAD(P)-dependent dehydrogenase (short-subunit alcohol dehydrogenase family)